ncbi:MAG TPA: ribosome maturation factor RimM [Alloacidobacterium sp.]|nr:ribosome maturation factor RimM [Alloacidobacterium sp.]
MTDPQPLVLVAHLVRPQGRDGELIADILTDFPERFAERRHLLLLSPDGTSSRPIELEDHWLHKGRIVLKFVGIDSISGAEALRGHDLAIPRDQRAPLEDDAVYIDDLIGCHVIDVAPGNTADIGAIAGVDKETTSAPLLVVKAAANNQELLIPFVKAYLRKIDLEQKRIEMSLPEGLLTINAPSDNEEPHTHRHPERSA